MIQLKPCPFCGGKAKMEDWDDQWIDWKYGTTIHCESCGAGISEVIAYGEDFHERAVKKWNTRANTVAVEPTKPNAAEICLDRAIAEFNSGMDDLMKQFDEVRKVIETMQHAYSGAQKEERGDTNEA